jgi:hypothetical protein
MAGRQQQRRRPGRRAAFLGRTQTHAHAPGRPLCRYQGWRQVLAWLRQAEVAIGAPTSTRTTRASIFICARVQQRECFFLTVNTRTHLVGRERCAERAAFFSLRRDVGSRRDAGPGGGSPSGTLRYHLCLVCPDKECNRRGFDGGGGGGSFWAPAKRTARFGKVLGRTNGSRLRLHPECTQDPEHWDRIWVGCCSLGVARKLSREHVLLLCLSLPPPRLPWHPLPLPRLLPSTPCRLAPQVMPPS